MVWKILTSALLDNDSCALLDLLFDPIVITSYSSVEELVHHYVQRLEILGCQAETGQSGVRLVRKELLLFLLPLEGSLEGLVPIDRLYMSTRLLGTSRTATSPLIDLHRKVLQFDHSWSKASKSGSWKVYLVVVEEMFQNLDFFWDLKFHV